MLFSLSSQNVELGDFCLMVVWMFWLLEGKGWVSVEEAIII